MKIIIDVLILALFLYSKLLPYQGKLDLKYQRIFNFFAVIFKPILNFTKKYIKPFQVGSGLSIDMAQTVLLLMLLLISNWI